MTLPNLEEPDGSIIYGTLEAFAGNTGADFILQLVNAITAAATGYTNLGDALEKIASQIGIPEFADLLLAAFEGITGSFFNFLPWFINLTDLLGVDLGIDPNDFNPVTVAVNVLIYWLSLLNPASLTEIPIFGDFLRVFVPDGSGIPDLAAWMSMVLPAQIRQPLSQLVTILVTVLDSIPIIGPPLGDAVEDLAAMFGLLKDTTTVAQDTATTTQAGLAALKARIDGGLSGAEIVDSFDRAADSSANGLGANWDQSYSSGSGTLGTDGDGNTKWYVSGSATRTCIARYSAATLTGDTQSVQIVLNEQPAGFIGISTVAEVSLCARMNAAKDAYIEARVDHNSCEIGYVVAGVYTRIGAAATISAQPGDLFELRCNGYDFELLQNNGPPISRTDAGMVSQLGASYRYIGLREKAAVQNQFGLLTQYRAPAIQVITGTVYTP